MKKFRVPGQLESLRQLEFRPPALKGAGVLSNLDSPAGFRVTGDSKQSKHREAVSMAETLTPNGSTYPPAGLAGIKGKYFLSWKDGELEWQGVVLDVYGDTHIMVLLFDWAWGQAGDQKFVPVAETGDWTFYETARDMRFASWQYHRATYPDLYQGTFEEDEAVHERIAARL